MYGGDFKMNEKRKSKRLDIDVRIKVSELNKGEKADSIKSETMVVSLVNISRDGIGFTSTEELRLSTYFDVEIVLWTKESFKSVIEIVRMEAIDNSDEILYGCRFIGIRPADQLKIQIYEIINDIE